jgi:chaperonin GroEL (HSP60 family)
VYHRYCTQARTATIVLRGGTEQFLAESQRSMHDALMVVKRSMKACEVVAGGGAIEVTLLLAALTITITIVVAISSTTAALLVLLLCARLL